MEDIANEHPKSDCWSGKIWSVPCPHLNRKALRSSTKFYHDYVRLDDWFSAKEVSCGCILPDDRFTKYTRS